MVKAKCQYVETQKAKTRPAIGRHASLIVVSVFMALTFEAHARVESEVVTDGALFVGEMSDLASMPTRGLLLTQYEDDSYDLDRPDPATAPQRRPARVRRVPASEDVEDASSGFGLHRVTFDLGVSTGSVNGITYTEANLGLNLYFFQWLAWRNAFFGRFMTGEETLTGVDSSARLILNLDGGALGLTAFAGPGWRFVTKGDASAPLLEAGLVLRLAGLALGGGMKTIINSAIRSGAPNDTQYFLILSGGGRL